MIPVRCLRCGGLVSGDAPTCDRYPDCVGLGGMHPMPAPKPPTTVSCCSCGETEAEAVAEDLGWRYGTMYDGEARWSCPDCQEPATDWEGRRIGKVATR